MPEVTSQHCQSLHFHSVLKHVQVNTFIWAENGGSFLFLLFYSKAHPVFSLDVNPVHFTFTREKKLSIFCGTFVSRIISHSALALPTFN